MVIDTTRKDTMLRGLKRIFGGQTGQQKEARPVLHIAATAVYPKRDRAEPPEPQNLYSAARQSQDRTRMYIHVQDARFDANDNDRQVLVGKSRYFAANNPFVSKILEITDAFVNGPGGLSVEPSNRLSRVNDKARALWEEWQDHCDFLGQHKFHYLTSMMLRLLLVDGECFVVLRDEPGKKPQHTIQLYETHRVRNPRGGGDTKNVINGIEYDPHGRPVAYYISEGLDGRAAPVRKPAKDVIHVFAPSRPWQLRGVPAVTPAINTLHDLEMLETAETRAAKANASVVAFISTPEGEVTPEDIQEAMARGGKIESFEGSGDVVCKPVDEQTHRMLEESIGGDVYFVREGVKRDQIAGERPSEILQKFWEYQIEKICIAMNISKLLVFPQSMQGTVTRADIASTDATFKALFSIMSDVVLRCYRWAMTGYSGEFGTVREEDYIQATISPPRSITADFGRESAAKINEYRAGFISLDDVAGRDGRSAEEIMRKRAQNYMLAKKICDEAGIDDSRIIYNPLAEQNFINTSIRERVDESKE